MIHATAILFILLCSALSVGAQPAALSGDTLRTDMGHPRMIHLRTNLLYDAALLPSVGVEFAVGRRSTMAVNATCNWLGDDDRHRYWRMATVDAEVRWWLGSDVGAFMLRGHHLGVYVAAYRYDIEFGGKGQMGDLNYGGGFSYGYSAPVGRKWSLDFTVGVGYIGGKYKEYEPSRDTWNHYVVQEERDRRWLGPTKAEVTLVWHIELPKRR